MFLGKLKALYHKFEPEIFNDKLPNGSFFNCLAVKAYPKVTSCNLNVVPSKIFNSFAPDK